MKVVYKVVQENAELQRACNTCTGIEASMKLAGCEGSGDLKCGRKRRAALVACSLFFFSYLI